MRNIIDNVICFIVAGILLMSVILSIRDNLKEKEYIKQLEQQIKQLEQSLAEQIQEVEVYRGILEEYQIKGIINE